jgi:hypothetical protein
MGTGLILDHAWSAPASVGSANEDGWGALDSAFSQRAFIIDGCTDYDPEGSARVFPGAATAAFWHKETLTTALRVTPRENDDLPNYVRRVVEKVRSDFAALDSSARPAWTLPCSTLALVELVKSESKLRLAITGDSSVLCKSVDGEVKRFPLSESASDGELEVARLLHEPGKANDALHLRRARREQLINAGLHCISVFPDRLFDIKVYEISRQECASIILASDGFMRLVDVFSAQTIESLFENAGKGGLHLLGKQLRELERANAPTGKTSRIKIHDDATAVLFRIA